MGLWMARFFACLLLPAVLLTVPARAQFSPPHEGSGRAEKTCTLLGCFSMVVLSIQHESRRAPRFDVRIEVDGKTLVCPAPALAEDAPRCGDGTADIEIHEIQNCETVEYSPRELRQVCRGTGTYEERVRIYAAPEHVTVSLQLGTGKVVETRTLTPEYEMQYPNGKDCDPVCRFWKTTWILR